jgi:toxin ParE1/3/4
VAQVKVRWTSPALQQLRDARRYVEAENPSAADRIGRRIEEAVNRLAFFPDMGRVGRRAGTRELAVSGTNFVVAYRVTAESIDILAVIHGARQWPENL